MSWIYDLPDGRKACIYTEGRRILFHTFSGRSSGASAVLKEDCSSGPVCLMYYGTIYFAYIDMEGEIVFDGIGSGDEIRTRPEGKPEALRIACAAGRVSIFYLSEAADMRTNRLNMWDPYEGTTRMLREENQYFQYSVQQMNNTVLLVLYRGSELICAGVWEGGEFRDVQEDASEQRREKARLLTAFEQERESAEKEKRRYEKELEAERRHSREQDQKLKEYERVIRQREQEIAYASRKYDELAGYASKLQKAVKQWREQYMEEIS